MARRFAARLICAAFSFALLGMDAGQSLRVNAVRFWPQPGAIRIAIETNGDFRFHTDRLQNPDRVFFDLFGARPRLGGKGIRSFPVGHPLIKRIRVAETLPGVTRVVLDLNGEAEVTATKLSNPFRLMVDVRPVRGSASAQTATLKAPQAVVPPRAPRPFVPPQRPPLAPPLLPDAPPLLAERPVAPRFILAAVPRIAPPAAMAAERPRPAPPVIRTGPAKPARSNSDGGRSLTRALGLKINRVVLDPGHGGHDQGTIGAGGLVEKDLVLDVAKRLGALIEKRLGAEVVYTRTDDTFIPLEERTALANERQADLFLSLHANSSPYRSVAGIETFYLNFTSSKDALEVAARENASSQKTVHELRDLIQKITLQDKSEESREFAGRIQDSLYAFAARTNAAARNRGVKKAPFVVLIGAVMPSVLVEIGFLTNPREEALLKRPEHRQRLAEALYRGVARYAQGLSHFQVAQKDEAAPSAVRSTASR